MEQPKQRRRRPKGTGIGAPLGAAPEDPAEEPSSSKPLQKGNTYNGIVVRTKFPVARIKRIMQADQDIGKVAQVTPVIVSKALELFMISICSKACEQARSRNSKRITAAHLKQVVNKEEQFDFLAEVMTKVPDVSLPQEVSGHNGDSDEGGAPRKFRGRKPKDEDI